MITPTQYFGLAYSLLLLLLSSSAAHASSINVDQEYIKQPGVSGSITSVGSDTLANLMTSWSVEFRQLYPQVKFQIQASGSSTAPPALTEGTANIGPMSREMKATEINYFSRKHGYQPFVVKVAVDAIALFVDIRNPLMGLTLTQVDSVFSETRYCGSANSVNYWRDLGVMDDYRGLKVKVFGRNSVSGTYGLFKKLALCDGDFKATVNELPGSSSVVQSVAYSNGAIGYAAYGHKTAAVKVLSIADYNGEFIPANSLTIANGEYPLTRFLYLVVNKSPEDPLPLLEQEFLRFVLSKLGQQLVRQEGYVAIPKPL
ncbi:phosphate ABC transporter substrate-binding protein, partial [Aliiglaciecola sp.]|nr:phosphate ABC transporter substrate-binding protein [Aliiglaciecola sp.]